ncbi:hypothetical protein VKI21_09655 [Cyanobacterium aponinum UTEX 3222]|nr:hypothetical protein [Cyanobacterium aponinum]WRL43927.1 hypothetical protein VKI21_09655 [Cyanobacterium aponinum UTEX 3222]
MYGLEYKVSLGGIHYFRCDRVLFTKVNNTYSFFSGKNQEISKWHCLITV